MSKSQDRAVEFTKNIQVFLKGGKTMKKSLTILVTLLFVAATLAFMSSEAGAAAACAQINANGTIAPSSFRVNTAVAETRRLSLGQYEIDFTPVSTDVRFFAKSATIDTQLANNPANAIITLADRSGDLSSVFVMIRLPNNALVDQGFSLCLY